MTLEDSVQRTRLRVLQRARELGNVSAACREAGISRTLLYRWKKQFTCYGIDGLHPRRTATRPGRRIQLDSTKERKIVAMALAWPSWGPKRLTLQLEREGVVVSPSTVWRSLHRLGLGTQTNRLLVLEVQSVKLAGPPTEQTRRRFARLRGEAEYKQRVSGSREHFAIAARIYHQLLETLKSNNCSRILTRGWHMLYSSYNVILGRLQQLWRSHSSS